MPNASHIWNSLVKRGISLLYSIRLVQFLSVGAVGALIDNGILFILVEVGALAPEIAAVGSKEVSILSMFSLNELWTFSGEGDETSRLSRLMKSHSVRIGGAIIGIATLYILHRWVGIWYLLANILGIGVGFLFNYVFESYFTWNVVD